MESYTQTTFSDWYCYYGTSGPEGLHRICDFVADAGMKRLYLRTHEGGMACYPSTRGTILRGAEAFAKYEGYAQYPPSYYNYFNNLDYSTWDAFDALPTAAAAAGLEAAPWYTIMEDDHGGMYKSQFLLDNPDLRCVNREGNPVDGCLEFWFPAVRQYKLSILEELLDHGAERVLLDLVRRNGTPSADVDGYYRYGFNGVIVEDFQRQSGLNPSDLKPGTPEWKQWVDHCGGPTTDFIIEACQLIRDRGAIPDLLVWAVDLKNWMGIDLPRILDTGLVESVQINSQAYGMSPADLDRQLDAIAPQVGDRAVQVVPSIAAYEGCAVDALDSFFEAMEERNVDAVTFHEADTLIRNRLSGRFRAFNHGLTPSKRSLRAERATGSPASEPKTVEGFCKVFNVADISADQLTRAQATHDGQDLTVRVMCSERDITHLRPVPTWPADNCYVQALGARTYWSPMQSVHLFLSPQHMPGDYFHLVIDPEGTLRQETRFDERWQGDWTGNATIEEDQWIAEFSIPLTTLDLQPTQNIRMGVQIVRVQSEPQQVSLLHPMTTNILNPDEFGNLYLIF